MAQRNESLVEPDKQVVQPIIKPEKEIVEWALIQLFKKTFRLGEQPYDVSREFKAFKYQLLMKIYGEKPVEVFENIVNDMLFLVEQMKDDGVTADRKDDIASLATMLLDVLCKKPVLLMIEWIENK